MTVCEQAGLRWNETTVSEILMSQVAQAEAVSVVPFTQPAEAISGADWIWWWVDDVGAYGMLVQAKRVTITEGKWRFGFNYASGQPKKSQYKLLRSTANALPELGTVLSRASRARSLPHMHETNDLSYARVTCLRLGDQQCEIYVRSIRCP